MITLLSTSLQHGTPSFTTTYIFICFNIITGSYLSFNAILIRTNSLIICCINHWYFITLITDLIQIVYFKFKRSRAVIYSTGWARTCLQKKHYSSNSIKYPHNATIYRRQYCALSVNFRQLDNSWKWSWMNLISFIHGMRRRSQDLFNITVQRFGYQLSDYTMRRGDVAQDCICWPPGGKCWINPAMTEQKVDPSSQIEM